MTPDGSRSFSSQRDEVVKLGELTGDTDGKSDKHHIKCMVITSGYSNVVMAALKGGI